jgi:hypothetical protein
MPIPGIFMFFVFKKDSNCGRIPAKTLPRFAEPNPLSPYWSKLKIALDSSKKKFVCSKI